MLKRFIMALLTGLLMCFGLLRGITFLFHTGNSLTMDGILATAVMFLLIGTGHFAKPEKIEAMIPPRWPCRRALNYSSGAAEIVLGAGLLMEATRPYAAIGLLLLLAAVFPANIYVARTKPSAYSISRLFFQPVYMAWIWWFCLKGPQAM